MTDDDRITELFQAAASDADAPPPGFDHQDVVAVSRRITARRRSAVIGGVVALLVVAGVGTVATLPRSNTSTLTTAAAPEAGSNTAGSAAAAAAPEAAVGAAPAAPGADSAGGTAAAPPEANGSGAGSGAAAGGVTPGGGTPGGVTPGGGTPSGVTPGGGTPGGVTPGGGAGGGAGAGAGGQKPELGTPAHPLGPGTTLCANRQDPALRALLVAVLPEAGHAPGAATSDICLPGTQRYLSLELGGGVLTVAYLPPGTVTRLSDGAKSAPTASHGTVIVTPAPGYSDRVPKLLQYLAPRL